MAGCGLLLRHVWCYSLSLGVTSSTVGLMLFDWRELDDARTIANLG